MSQQRFYKYTVKSYLHIFALKVNGARTSVTPQLNTLYVNPLNDHFRKNNYIYLNSQSILFYKNLVNEKVPITK